MSVSTTNDGTFLAAVGRIAREIAAANADEVDRDARFPIEAITALREERALSALVPANLGGEGLGLESVAAACLELGRACGSTGMVFAMHQIQVGTMARHLDDAQWFESYLSSVAAEQRLVASVTTELGTGGDMGRSVAAPEPLGEAECKFEKKAPTVSYAEHADDLFVTLRRSPDAEASDQVAALARRGEFTLERTGTWDTLGMRGTCSPGYVVNATLSTQQILPTPFATVMAESLVPITHILWSHVWLGIATDAFERARSFVREAAKRQPETTSPAAVRLSHLLTQLSLLRAEVRSALEEFLRASAEPGRESLSTMASALRFNSLKIAASEQTPRICQEAMGICGIMGYKNDTPFSVGRHVRDAGSAALMIANERIHQTNASLLLIAKEI